MRATRFRLRAGCLSWEKKDGTAAKNQRILDVIPAQYKDPGVNSTKGWRDLSKAEIKSVKAGALKKPQLGPKEKRAAQAGKVQATKEDRSKDLIEGEGLLRDGVEVQSEDEGSWIGAPNKQDNRLWPEHDPARFEGPILEPQMSYADPQHESYSSLPRHQVAQNEEVQLMRQGYLAPQSHLAAEVIRKRKRPEDSVTEHSKGQRPTKRAKGHTK